MILVTSAVLGSPTKLLHAFRVVIFEYGSFLEEEGKLLEHHKVSRSLLEARGY